MRRHKVASRAAKNRHNGRISRLLSALLLLALVAHPAAVLAVDEECDTTVTFTSPANDLCVPALSAAAVNVDGVASEWTAGTFYDYTDYSGSTPGARARVSRKATGVEKSDLYLFFDVSGDAVATNYDEIRVALNPGTTATNSTLLKVYPFNGGAGTATFHNFNGAAWPSAGAPGGWFAFNKTQNNVAGTWTVEIKISLDQIPTHPITGSTFRLYLELISDNNVTKIPYQWPAHYGYVGLHDFVCSNPARWRPMSFGTGCFPDLNIANGAYSCGAIYVLRNGAKSTEISTGMNNEIHADVTNPGPGNAANVQVYLALLRAGISAGPVAMNFDHNDASIRQFFNDKYGAWLTPVDKLDSGTPRPPAAFNVNGGITNTDARFNWNPSDETRFGAPADFVGSHKCTGAFVNFKDDPNFANNLSYCNTSIVSCPTGQICLMAFWVGPYFAYRGAAQDGKVLSRFVVSTINAPFEGWLKRSGFRIEGAKQVADNVWEAEVPGRGEIEIKAAIQLPREVGQAGGGGLDLVPAAHAQPAPSPVTKDERGGSEIADDLKQFLAKQYGGKPVIFIQGVAETSRETALGGQEGTVPLSRPTNYVAFVVDTGGGAGGPSPTPTPKAPSGCACGKSTSSGFIFSASFVVFGLALVWRRARRRSKKRVPAAPKG